MGPLARSGETWLRFNAARSKNECHRFVTKTGLMLGTGAFRAAFTLRGAIYLGEPALGCESLIRSSRAGVLP